MSHMQFSQPVNERDRTLILINLLGLNSPLSAADTCVGENVILFISFSRRWETGLVVKKWITVRGGCITINRTDKYRHKIACFPARPERVEGCLPNDACVFRQAQHERFWTGCIVKWSQGSGIAYCININRSLPNLNQSYTGDVTFGC